MYVLESHMLKYVVLHDEFKDPLLLTIRLAWDVPGKSKVKHRQILSMFTIGVNLLSAAASLTVRTDDAALYT